jgi:Sodium:dicarboxylate symporter family
MSTTNLSEDNKPAGIGGCGPLARYPILSVVSFAAVGIALGIGLGAWEPEDDDTKANVLKWFGLLGDLFVRALKAVILPLVFCNVAVSVVDMMLVGRASSVGVLTIVLYTATTVMAATIGAISILCFGGLFEEKSFTESGPSYIALGCQAEGSFLTEMGDGTLMCSASTTGNSSSQFEIIDVTGSLARTTGSKFADLTMSETIYDGLFIKMITDNIFDSLVDANFAAVR